MGACVCASVGFVCVLNSYCRGRDKMDLFFSSFSRVPAAVMPVWVVLGNTNCFERECDSCCLGLSISHVYLHLPGR